MTVVGMPFSRTMLPTTSAAPPKCCCQTPSGDHRDARTRRARSPLLGVGAPGERRQAEHVEEAGGRLERRQPDRLAAPGQIDDVLAVAGERAKAAAGSLVIEIVGGRKRAAGVAVAVVASEADDGGGIGIGKGAEQNAVDDGKNGRRAPDPERQRDERDEREARRPRQRSERVADVLGSRSAGIGRVRR